MSELRAEVCASEILFPFAVRIQLKARYDTGEITPAEIAAAARIPVSLVRRVMGDIYYKMAERLNSELLEETMGPKVRSLGKA